MHKGSSDVQHALLRLENAISAGRKPETCLRHWSRFIRTRDEHRCVTCKGTDSIQAHHICRKSFLPDAALLTGNGITLCRDCHHEVHQGFNGKADLGLPMDAQGGEKIETMVKLFGTLLRDAQQRGVYEDNHYFLTESALSVFKKFQGFPPDASFPGQSLEQAFCIWSQTPLKLRVAMLRAALS